MDSVDSTSASALGCLLHAPHGVQQQEPVRLQVPKCRGENEAKTDPSFCRVQRRGGFYGRPAKTQGRVAQFGVRELGITPNARSKEGSVEGGGGWAVRVWKAAAGRYRCAE
eukprot:COSAG02_NODE_9815_length_2101_cov_5.293207_3_plen_111_part_00